MKFVAHLRVSTTGQTDGYGLDVQRAAVEEWSKTHRHRIVAWTTDVYTGKDDADEHLLGRDGLADALALLKAGEADGLVVPRLDRLARDMVLQEKVIAEVWSMGKGVASTVAAEDSMLADDPSDPTRKLIRRIMGAVAEYERELIVMRLQAGRRRKAEGNGYAYGSPRFGYRSEKRKRGSRIESVLVKDTTEQETLRRMRVLRDEGKSLRQIAAVLNDEERTAKRGGAWHPRTVASALSEAA